MIRFSFFGADSRLRCRGAAAGLLACLSLLPAGGVSAQPSLLVASAPRPASDTRRATPPALPFHRSGTAARDERPFAGRSTGSAPASCALLTAEPGKTPPTAPLTVGATTLAAGTVIRISASPTMMVMLVNATGRCLAATATNARGEACLPTTALPAGEYEVRAADSRAQRLVIR